MALTEMQRVEVTRRLNAFCDARVPAAVRHKLRLDFRINGADVVLFEPRPGFQRPEQWYEATAQRRARLIRGVGPIGLMSSP
jgi:hypothetical protein